MQQDTRRLQFAGGRHARQHGNKRDGDDIFDDRRAENDMREILVHLVHVLERLREDGRGRIADDRAEEQARDGPQSKRAAQFVADPQDDDHVQHRDENGRRPRVPQFAKVELQAEREHQEQNADIGQRLRGRAVLNPRQRMRPDQDSGQDIAENLRKPKELEHERRNTRGDDDDRQVAQYGDLAHAGRIQRARASRNALSVDAIFAIASVWPARL